MKRPLLSLFLAAVLVLAGLSYGSAGPPYPFSENIINWEDKNSRERYDEIFQETGIVLQLIPAVHPEMRIAHNQFCVTLKKQGVIVGYGAVFSDFLVSAFAEDKWLAVKIILQKVEALQDLDGRSILLTSHYVEKVLFRKWGEWRGRKPKEMRGIFKGPDLGEGFRLSEKSQRLAEVLTNFPRQCRELLGKAAAPSAPLQIAIDPAPFR